MLHNRTMPPSTVIPELVYHDVGEAISWLCGAFGFVERWRAGDHRAQLRVGDGCVVVRERRPGTAAGTGEEDIQSVLVRVEHVDPHHAAARAAGAVILAEPTDHAYGERQYSALDLAGHRWTFSESIADLEPEAWGGTTADLAPGT